MFLSQLSRMFHTPLTKLLNEMSSSELVYWEEVYKNEFIGEQRDDYRMARIETAIMNFAGKSLKEGIWYNPVDQMPYLERVAKEHDPNEVATQVKAAFGAVMGAQRGNARALERAKKREGT